MIISNPYKISKLKEKKRQFYNGEIQSYYDEEFHCIFTKITIQDTEKDIIIADTFPVVENRYGVLDHK